MLCQHLGYNVAYMPQCLGVGFLNFLSTSPRAICLRIPEWQSSEVSHIKSSSLNCQPPFSIPQRLLKVAIGALLENRDRRLSYKIGKLYCTHKTFPHVRSSTLINSTTAKDKFAAQKKKRKGIRVTVFPPGHEIWKLC